MKFSIARQRFLAELQKVSGVAGHKSPIPILTNVFLEAEAGGKVRLRATDLDLWIESTLVGETVVKPGAICVNARKLTEIVKNLPEGEIKVDGDKSSSQNSSKLQIQSGRSKFTIAGLPAKDFPDFKYQSGLKYVSVPSELLKYLVQQTEYCVTKMESRYTLNAVKLEIEDGIIRMVATDGHRMSIVEAAIETGGITGDLLIPRNTLPELATLATGNEVTKIACGGLLFAQTTHRVLHSRLVNGTFPDYKLVIPKSHAYECGFDITVLRAAVKQVKVMTDERSHTMRFIFTDQAIKLEAPACDLGDAASIISADYKGPEITTSINAAYLEEWLSVCPTDKGILELNDGDKQLLFRPVGKVQAASQYILMPMRV